jgi:integrase
MLAENDRGLTVNELFLAYWEHARAYYCKDGQATAEQGSIKEAVGKLIQFYGDTSANEFGPLSLKTVRNAMIERDLARSTINGHIGRIKRIFRWGTENELVDAKVFHSLQAVAGLRRGRSAAKETPPVRPVPEQDIQAVLPHVSPQVAAMIRLQYLTGMRSGEVMIMRGCDLETRGKTWKYTPSTHKTEHHGIERIIFLGPQAQAVLAPFLKPGDAFLFCPQDAEAMRIAERRRSRRTHMWKSHEPERRRARRRVRFVVRSVIADHEHEPRRAARCHELSPTRLSGLDTVRI